MGKFRKGLMKRVMSVILSGAMIMSNMTVYAAEIGDNAAGEYIETVSESSESEAEETASREAEKAEDDAVAEENTANAADEDETTVSTETDEKLTETEASTETTTDASETETTEVIASTEETEATETASETETETTATASETEEITETETEQTEEETTEESEDNAEAGDAKNWVTSDGLTASKEGGYGDDILNFTVLCDMTYKKGEKEIEGVTYPGYVLGGANANNAAGKNPSEGSDLIPATGAAFKIQPLKDAKITFAIGASDNKTFFFVKANGANGELIDKSAKYGSATGFAADAYTFNVDAGETYYFYGVATRLSVYAISWYDRNENRPAWAEVANPVISAALSENDKEKIQVTVDAVIGSAGADKVTVYMYDEENTEVTVKESNKEQNQTVFEFEPSESGKYTFKAVTSREKEQDVKESISEPITCTVSQKWKFTVYGNGTSSGKDSCVENEDGSVTITSASGKIVPNSNDGLAFYYTTVPSSMNFTFSANAHVNSWKYSNGQEGFGIMAADTIGDLESGSRFWNNSYQAVISKISYHWNGLEVSEDNSGEQITMQLGVGSTEKIGVTPEDITAIKNNDAQQPAQYKAVQTAIDTTFAKYGTGQYNIVDNCEEAPIGSDHELYEDFWLQIQKNNTGYFVSYAKYKFQKDEQGNVKKDEQTGKPLYALEDGKKVVDYSTIITKKYYDPAVLSVLDPKRVYVGVFAARNATITFTDMNLTPPIPSEEDAPREQDRPVKYLNLSNSILSSSVTNIPDYTFMFASNWKGTFVLKDSNGNPLGGHNVTDENGNEKWVYEYEVKGTLDPEIEYYQDGDNAKDTKVRIDISNLSIGRNDFTVEYTPDKDWTPERDKYTGKKVIELKSYDMVKIPFSVEYKKYGQEGQTIYVSQDGKNSNLGTKESPLDIYTAVKYVQPGQTILLAGGRYSLNRTLQITKGINGKPDLDENGKETYNKYIKMIGDPEADERPILDFNGTVAAVVVAGDYWYFKDFDVIRCKDGEKGVQVSGSWCVYDRIDTYRNGSTGLQICRAASTDTYRDWPHDNLILNCNSYLNVDRGYEDADGFAAKLTSGSNNVFDGCIAAFNADDGWDLFAKAQTGCIGGVVIKNSIAYRNGYVLKAEDGSIDVNGKCVKGDGNGNGFKMGGDGLPAGSIYDDDYGKDPNAAIPNIGHKLYNSLAFGNKSKGFDSNSAPNVKIYNSISFNNDAANIGLSTYDTNKNTDYELRNVISMRSDTNPSRIEPDVREFSDGYKTTHSINFMSDANPGIKSSAVYFSLKNAKSMKADVKVWWRSSDASSDCQMMVLTEKGEVIAAGKETSSDPNQLMVSELTAAGKEKCYLGSKGGAVNLYKVEITVEEKKEDAYEKKTYLLDISQMDDFTQYTENHDLDRNGKKDKAGTDKYFTLYYRAIPEDNVDKYGIQKQNPEKVDNETVYYWDIQANAAKDKVNGKQITAEDFVSLDYPYLNTVSPENWRNEDGTIKTNGFLELKPNAGSYPEGEVPSLGGTESKKPDTLIGEDTDGSVSSGNAGTVTPGTSADSDYGEDFPTGGLNIKDEKGDYVYFGKIWAADINYVNFTEKEPIVYTGKAITPEVHVRFSGNSALLRKGKDYKLKYENNINAGKATVTIIGAGDYTGYENTKEFTIKPIRIGAYEGKEKDESVFVPSCVAAAAGKDPQNEIKPTWCGKALKKGTDYSVKTHPTDSSKLIVTGGDSKNFVGESEVTVYKDVSADKLMSKASVKITTKSNEIIYNRGEGITVECDVTLGGKKLAKNQDYTVEYANNREIGKATLTVVGINNEGTGYFGSKSVNFTIKGGNLKDADIKYEISKDNRKPLTDYVAALDNAEFNGGSHKVPENRIKVTMNGRDLKNGTDFKVIQKGTEKAGTAVVTIKGINGYTGVQTFKFKILPFDITDKTKLPDTAFSFRVDNEYTIGGVKFTNFKITINNIGIDPRNYSLSYKNNNVAAMRDSAKPPTVIVTGRNGLKGKREFTFNINPAPMTGNPDIALSAKDIAANGKELKYSDFKRAAISVTQTVNNKSMKLAAGRDYDKDKIEYYIDTNGDYKIDDNDKRVDITSKAAVTEFDADKGYMTVLVRVHAATGNPKCCFSDGYVDGYFRVGTYDINKAKVISLQDRVFGIDFNKSDGTTSALSWDTVIADVDKYIELRYKKDSKGGETTINWIRKAETEYLVRPQILENSGFVIVPNSYKKNERVGTASFEIRGTGEYSGTKRITFKILNKKTADKLAEKNKK